MTKEKPDYEPLFKKYKKDLKGAFDAFAKFGSRNSQDGNMDGKTYFKLFRDCEIVNKKFTSIDVDLVFAKYKIKNGGRKITWKGFKESLVAIGIRRFPKLATEKGSEVALKNVILRIKKHPAPVTVSTKTDFVRFHDDESSYTGKHKRQSTPVKKKKEPRLQRQSVGEEKKSRDNVKADKKKAKEDDKKDFYNTLLEAIKFKIDDEIDVGAVTANISSYVYWALNKKRKKSKVNFVGFYIVKQIKNDQKDNKDDEDAYKEDNILILGGFHGKPSVMKIRYDTGVVGKCATTTFTLVVKDVHDFEGHIECDSNSKSEIVIPVFSKEKELVAVLDLDCTELNGFDDVDKEHLENIANYCGSTCEWSPKVMYNGQIPTKEYGCKVAPKKYKKLL